MSSDANDFLNSSGSGAPSAALDQEGASVKGVILDLRVTQMRNFKTKELEVWPNGDPKEQLVIVLQTDERDADIEDDDGRRTLYAPKDSRDGSKFKAIQEAVKAVRSSIQVGGTLAVVWTATEEPANKTVDGRRLYQAAYKAAEATGAAALLDDAKQSGEPFPATAQAAPATPAVDPASLL